MEQFEEDADFGFQHFRQIRLKDEIDTSRTIAAGNLIGGSVSRGDEDDRSMPRASSLTDEFRGLESIHVGHADIEEDHRKIPVEKEPQRFLARTRSDEVLSKIFQDRFKGVEIVGAVIHEQDRCF